MESQPENPEFILYPIKRMLGLYGFNQLKCKPCLYPRSIHQNLVILTCNPLKSIMRQAYPHCINRYGLFVLMLYVPVNNFQLYQDVFPSSWVEPELSRG